MPTPPKLLSRLHHAAYTTRNLEATRKFYEEIIGLPLESVWCERDEIFGEEREFCHALFGLGDGSALSFFQFADADDQALFSPTIPFTPFHHIAIRVDSEVQRGLESRLHDAGYREPQTLTLEHGYCRSVYVVDPNGMLLELTRDHPDFAENSAARKASAHSDLRRWLSGDHRSNNGYRQSIVRLCQLALLAFGSSWLSGCALTSDDVVWESEARQALGRSDDEENPNASRIVPGRAHFYTGSIADALEFWRPHPTGNGRSCATCHRPEDNFALTPKTVEARWQLLQARRRSDPDADDPLFRSIDADDFVADFTTLRTRALVRVTRPLPENVRLADDPAATTVSVFRAVPTVVNTAFTAPFQSDGRRATLEDQALHAVQDHSQVQQPLSAQAITRIANFQRHLFSSKRVSELADALADESSNERPSEITINELEQQGLKTFERFCASCHSGPTLAVNDDARFLPLAARGPRAEGPQEFVNIFVQTPRPPPPFAPAPAPITPRFFDGLPTAGLAITTYGVTMPDGSRASVQSSDAGRMLISGDIRENGRFAVPTLFGAAYTAPYFHDNSADTLEAVIEHYQAMFEFMAFLDIEAGAFGPVTHAQGCDRGTCNFTRIPDAEIPGLLAFLRTL